MGDRLRPAVGVMGNVASMLLYTAPILTFSRVIKKKSTEEYSCVPYIIALLNCFLYTWYGLPIVSYSWENFPLITINSLGLLLELSFILIYFWFASTIGKKKVTMITIPVILIFCITPTISTFAFRDHHNRKVFVGTIGLVASVVMYDSPLVVVQVIRIKSVEFMPFYLSFFSFLASLLWMAYRLLSHDLLLSPKLVGSPLGIVQLVLYFKYKKMAIINEPAKWNIEKNSEKTKQQLQLVTTEDTNGKI
ncbi:bidirectional sugar transporter SWEET3-like [Camellia sinensis]|uniref:bidirectional sugar transporter SWEET3-like n=1 Tax=Camellia sinensis TaxID=4442 RepID=UPI0010367682|nr:bidirectional sugar transporter SWEET3-like [Camellia sinensis]